MKSMTGFGAAEKIGRHGKILVEVRSYNHRFLDLRLRLHRVIQAYEPRIYQWARKRLVRGRVEINVQWEEPKEERVPFQFDLKILAFYQNLEKKLRDEFSMPGQLDIPTLMRLREFVSTTGDNLELEEEWADVLHVVEAATEKLEEMQETEGETIQQDLIKRLQFISERLEAVRALARKLTGQYKEKIEEKISKLMSPEQYDPQRVAQEIVIYVDKIDVTEEIVRLASHLEVCEKALRDRSMTGKRLDFLSQEILRELNTIGSKSSHADIIYHVVDMKTELEKIREQAQNIQ